MTKTKGRTWINVHLRTEMHARLNSWCRRNGLSQQDGLEAMIDICAREVNGLQLMRRVDPPPIVHAQLRADPPVAAKPVYTPSPELKEPYVYPADEEFERARAEIDPDALYIREMGKGLSAEAAGNLVKSWCASYDVHLEWEPPAEESKH